MQSGAPSADWLNKASPEDLLTHGKQIFSRIGQLDQTYRERFVAEARQDPQAAHVIEQMTEPTS